MEAMTPLILFLGLVVLVLAVLAFGSLLVSHTDFIDCLRDCRQGRDCVCGHFDRTPNNKKGTSDETV